MSITINAPTLPTFTQLGPYCQNETPGTLSLTSDNGIAGTWSPSVVSTATVGSSTYTFTPSSSASPVCATTATMSITINALPTLTSLNGGGAYCSGTPVLNIVATVTGIPNWTINYTLDGISQTASGTTSSISLGNTAGVYVITGINDANCLNAGVIGTQTITITATPIAPNVSDGGTFCEGDVIPNLTASPNNGGTLYWYEDQSLTLSLGTGTTFTPQFILGQTSYYITENVNGCEGPPSQITVSIKDCEKLDIIIPTAFTPNGDEENDFWELIDISTIYPNHKVYIYNRWGSLLYESEFGAYQLKPWDGTTNGNPLPVGSYYYIIDALGDGSSYLKGVVSIILD